MRGRRCAFVGFNITESDAPKSMGGPGWKATLTRVSGPVVAGVEKIFWEAWAASTPLDGPAEPCLPLSEPAKAGNKRVAVVYAGGIRNVRSIRRSYRCAIDRAKEYIHITNAYFLPDRLVYRRLVKAAQRGVDVRIIAPRDTDYPYVRLASWAMYGHLIKNGVKIYDWQGPILHSKTAVIDGQRSSVGSHNLDHRRLHYKRELHLNIHDAAFGAVHDAGFPRGLEKSSL